MELDAFEAPELSGVGLTRLLGGKPGRLPTYFGLATIGLDAQRDGPVRPRLYTQGVRVETPALAAGAVNVTLQVGAAPGNAVCIHRVTAYARDATPPIPPQDPTFPITPMAAVTMDLFHSAGLPSPDGPNEELVEESVGTDTGGPLALVVAPSLPSAEVMQLLDRVAGGVGFLQANGPLYMQGPAPPDTARHDSRVGVNFETVAVLNDVYEIALVLTYTAGPVGMFPFYA